MQKQRWLVAVVCVVGGAFLLSAEIATIDLVGNLVNPIQACDKALPAGNVPVPERYRLVVTKAELSWPPPLVDCEATREKPPSTGIRRMTAVTTKNVTVVAILDVIALAILAWLATRAVSAFRGRRQPAASASHA